MDPYPRLQKLFLPLAQCIKRGDLYAFDQALKEGEDEFVKRRIYLPLERSHDTCLRNLLRKVFIAGGTVPDVDPPTRRTRIPIAEFTAAIGLSSKQQVDSDEVECLLANMIYKVSQGLGLLPCEARQSRVTALSKLVITRCLLRTGILPPCVRHHLEDHSTDTVINCRVS